jgi:hypothetical protein
VTSAPTTISSTPAANDNAYFVGAPVVRTPRRRSDATYSRSENVILPLRFAQRMPGWQPGPGARP